MSAHCSDNPQIKVGAGFIELGEIPTYRGPRFFLLGRELSSRPVPGISRLFLLSVGLKTNRERNFMPISAKS